MSTEHDTARVVEAWLAEPEPSLDDRVIRSTIDRLPGTSQRRRWWPFRWFPFGIGATRSADSSGPHSNGRSRSMFNATRIAATVAIVALGGSLALVAGPLGPSSGPATAPGAAPPSALAAPNDETYFTGVMTFERGLPGTTEVGTDDISRNRGAEYAVAWESTDPRITGVGDYTGNTNDYRTASDGVVSVGWGTMSVETEDGTWHSATPVGGVVRRPITTDIDTRIPVWFVGDGAYEGMTALVIHTITPSLYPPVKWNYEGWIVPGDAHLTEMVE